MEVQDQELRVIERSNVLLDLSRTITGSLDLQEVLDKSLAALRRLIDFGGGAIQLMDDGHLLAAATDPPATTEAMTVRIPIGEGVSGRIAKTCRPIYIPDILADERVHDQGRRKGVSGGVRSYFGAPLIMHGEAIGVVQIDAPEVNAFSAADRSLVLAFLPTIAASVQNALMFKREIETIEQLRETERMKDDFLAIASHELRTPLTSLTGFSATLAKQVGSLPPDVVSEFAARIFRASQQLERLVADLLDIARIEHGTLKAEPIPSEIGPVVRDALAALNDDTITLDVEDGLPAAVVDPPRLRQILLNLISNARKFSDPESPIEIHAFRQGALVAVSVTDHGVGIDADKLERIFDRFFQIDPALTRRAGGLGVGLYLVRKLVDLMDAKMGVYSAPGKGSTFTVYLRSARG